MLPVYQCCPRCCSDSERKKISRLTYFWLDMTAVSLQTGWEGVGGRLIQYNVRRCRSTPIRGKGRRGVLGGQKSSLHGAKIRSSSFVLLRRLGRRALRLAVLSGGGFAAPGGVVAQGRGAVEVVLVVQAVGGVVLRVLQAGDQTLILVPELAAHQGRLAHDHHVLDGQRQGEQILQLQRITSTHLGWEQLLNR